MNDQRKVSLCIPTYNRVDMTIRAFLKVIDDPRIDEVIIVDDSSDLPIYHDLQKALFEFPKVKLYRNVLNQDCYFNKRTAISFAKNDYCILLDSDNIISTVYLNKIFEYEWQEKVIFTPEFALPHFDFRAYSGLTFNRTNIAEYIDKPMFEVMCNAANYFVNKMEYLKVFDEKTNPVTSDSIYMVLNWLKNDGSIFVVPGLQYIHTVHKGSHYQNNVNRTPHGFHQNILQGLRNMK